MVEDCIVLWLSFDGIVYHFLLNLRILQKKVSDLAHCATVFKRNALCQSVYTYM